MRSPRRARREECVQPFADSRSGYRGALAPLSVDDEQRIAGELPLLERRLRTERAMNRIVEHQRSHDFAVDLGAVALSPFDPLEQRPVALEPARTLTRFRDPHDVADVVTQQRHPSAAQRRHEHSRQATGRQAARDRRGCAARSGAAGRARTP